ncbi:pas pac sensor signal transduction histidine kinase [Nannochloropsis oceanica]
MRSSPGLSVPLEPVHPASSLATTELDRSLRPHRHLASAPAAACGIPSNSGDREGLDASECNATALRTTISSAQHPGRLATPVNAQQAQEPTDSKDGPHSQPWQQPFPLKQHISRSDLHQHQHQQHQQKQQTQQQTQQLPLSHHAVPPPAAFAHCSVYPPSVSTASSFANTTQAAAGLQAFPVRSSITSCIPSSSSSSSFSPSSCSTASISPRSASFISSLKVSTLASSIPHPHSDTNMKAQHHVRPSSSSLLIPVGGLHPHQVSNPQPPPRSIPSSPPCSNSGPFRVGLLPGIPLESQLHGHHLDPFSGTKTTNSSSNNSSSSSSNSCEGGEEDKFGWRASRKGKRARRADLNGFTAEEKQERRKARARLYSAQARERQECEMKELRVMVEALSAYKLIVEEAPDMMCVLSAEREEKILYANSAFARLLGLVPASLLGRRLGEMVHAEDLKEVLAAFTTTLLSTDTVAKTTCRLKSCSVEGERDRGGTMGEKYVKVGLGLRKGTQGLLAIIRPEG